MHYFVIHFYICAGEKSERKFEEDMSEKTPVSVLQELCIQERASVPMFEEIPHESDPKMFACAVGAFGFYAKGSGRSKKEAKHHASENLINVLSKLEQFKQKLSSVPQTPRPVSEVDAVGTLLDICVQRNWPIAKFDEMQACGEPHCPEFTVICQLAHIKRTGTSSTKKRAKQIAAQEMLTFVQSIQQNEEQQQIATVDAEPTEKTFRTYRELKKSDIKPISIRIRDRHNHFMRLPGEDRQSACNLLNDNRTIYGTSKDKVDLICKALKLQYDVKDIPDHKENYKVFMIHGDYDCVIADAEPALYDHIIQYFKVMMNVTQIY